MTNRSKRQRKSQASIEDDQANVRIDNNDDRNHDTLGAAANKGGQQEQFETERHEKKRKRPFYIQDNDTPILPGEYPWLELLRNTPSHLTIKNIFQREVDCFLQYLEPTKVEQQMRKYLVHRIRVAIQKRFQGAQVDVFGSFDTQLYLPNSDIDIVVNYKEPVTIRGLANALIREGICRRPLVIARASVPVIKFNDRQTRLPVDITLNSESGLHSASVIKSLIEQQPGLRPLALIVKHYLALQKLNEVFTGGLGGYAIVCLVMSFLQMHPKVKSGEIDPLQHLGTLLVDFLQLYGVNFNFEKVGICVIGNGSYYKKNGSALSRQGRPVFNIRDPAKPDNDLGVKSYRASEVVQSFRSAYYALSQKLFELSEMAVAEDGSIRITRHADLSRFSVLSEILNIPVAMVKTRETIERAYSSKPWQGQEAAAKSFDWDKDK